MAYSPICIITSTGMVCASSPLKAHYPLGKACRRAHLSKAQKHKVDVINAAVAKTGAVKGGSAEVIAKVVELLIAMNVDKQTPFTIVMGR